MRMRESYRYLFPVLLLIFLVTGKNLQAQESLLDKEVTLSHTTDEIGQLLKEISRKGNFSFTYTSQIQNHRLASVRFPRQSIRNHLADIFRYDSIQIVEQNKKILLIPPPIVSSIKPLQDFKIIRGLIIDSKTRKPLSYSNVFLRNRSIGTISNFAGRFELKINSSLFNDTLGVSHIGFDLATIPVSSVDSGMLIIRLNEGKIQIREVVVKPLDPIYIITKAIETINRNYDCHPAIYTGFFRESTLQDNKNVSLSEAIINIYKEPYTSLREDQVKIYKGRKGSNTDEKEFVEFIVQGGLYNSLKLDIVKNLPSFLDADYFALYEYKVEKVITHLERLTYSITFEQREDVKYPCYKGRLYIDVESLAIVGAVFDMPESGMNYAAGIYIKKTPRHTGVKPIKANYEVFYRYYNNKWNLSNARSQVFVRVRRRKNKQDKFNSIFSSFSEFVITNKDTVNVVRFRTDEISRPRDILEKQIDKTDYEFWGNENIIIPDEPIEKAMLRVGRKNNLLTDDEIKAIRIDEEKEETKKVVSGTVKTNNKKDD